MWEETVGGLFEMRYGKFDVDRLPWTQACFLEAMRVFPGLAPSDHLTLNNQAHTRLSLQDAANGIKALYEDMLNRAWREAKARGEKLPPESQKAIPPTVSGQQ